MTSVFFNQENVSQCQLEHIIHGKINIQLWWFHQQYNSDQLHTTIRALIKENFDDGDLEYEKFLEDVEEEGFS